MHEATNLSRWRLTPADLISKSSAHTWLVIDDLLDLFRDAILLHDGDRADRASETGNIAGMTRRIDVQNTLPRS